MISEKLKKTLIRVLTLAVVLSTVFAAVGCDVVYLEHTDGISSSILRDRINK